MAAPNNSEAVDMQGTLEVMVEDYKDHAITRHFLKTDTGRSELHFKGTPTDLLTGTKVRVRGQKSGQTLEVAYLTSSSTSSSSTSTATAPLPNTLGAQKTLVLLVNFQDDTRQPWTTTDARNMVFGTVNNFYLENSFQQTSIIGDVYGWFTLSIASTCSAFDIAAAAKQAASSAGVNLAAYNHYIYAFPTNASCLAGGQGTIGGSPSEAWMYGYFDLHTIAHELGHNFGLYHSHSWDCDISPISQTCSQEEYGDNFDMMGGTTASHFNSFQKERLGWLNSVAMPPITTVGASGTYTLDPYETSGSNAKALKILKSTDASTGAKTWYYIEYRQAIGFDSVLASLPYSNIQNGVIVHLVTEADGRSSRLLDLTHASRTSYSSDWNDVALTTGQSFTDSAAGTTISTSWADTGSAGVTVTLGSTSSCAHANPTLTVTTPTTSVNAGTAVSYNVTVTNKDAADCSASNFNLTTNLPSGWTGNLAASILSINPGATATTTLTVTSPTTASPGTYPVGVTAANGTASAYSATANSSYSVAAASSATLSETITTDKTSYSLGQTVAITATVKSGGKPVSGAGVTFKITKSNGAIVIQNATTNGSGVAKYSLRLSKQKDPVGSYQLRADATSGSQSTSASSSFTVVK